MPSSNWTRRRLLTGSVGLLVGAGGCLSDPPATTEDPTTADATTALQTSDTPRDTPSDTPTGTPTDAVAVTRVTVANHVVYALSGAHPYVYRTPETQYVVVRLSTSLSARRVRSELTLELDGERVSFAGAQPVPWRNETVDLAFAVSKSRDYSTGRLLFGGDTLRRLSTEEIDRLNAPPRFEVSDVSAAPDAVATGEVVDATVEFTVENVGEGAGTFAASLSGNYVSGSATLTVTLTPGDAVTASGTTRIIGETDAAMVSIDWGSGEWTGSIPVEGKTETATPE